MKKLLLGSALFCCMWLSASAAEPQVSIRLIPSPAIAGSTGNESRADIAVPAMPFSLKQNTPDPFDSITTIPFAIYETVPVRLEVLNEAGDTVAVLVDDILVAGNHSVDFDASELPGGLYYYRLVSGVYNAMRSMIKNATTDVAGSSQRTTNVVTLAPNPSSGELRVCFAPSVAGSVTIEIFSVGGLFTTTLFHGYCDAREQTLTFSLDTAVGALLPAGQYWCRVVSPDGIIVQPFVLVR